MKGQSRRQLIQSCFSLAVAGLSSAVTSALAACAKGQESGAERGRQNPRAVATRLRAQFISRGGLLIPAG
jgi:hypothetical protein